MKYKPQDDGITHINVYSKGNTELGKLLSNFAHTPFRIPFMGDFQSVEGFWYWVITGADELKILHGWYAKRRGEQISLNLGTFTKEEYAVTKQHLQIAYKAKLRYNKKIEEMLMKNELPLTHYYVYNEKIVTPKEFQWTATLWEEIKNEKRIR